LESQLSANTQSRDACYMHGDQSDALEDAAAELRKWLE